MTLALKNLFKGKKGPDEQRLTIEDLIALERYPEAEEKLRHRLNIDPRDLHSRLRLADLLMRIGERVQAVDEYLLVAEGYARDGFYDKAGALLSKIGRYLPDNEKIRNKIAGLKRAKRKERRRAVVVEGLLNAPGDGGAKGGGRSAVELQQLWQNLEESPLVSNLSDAQLRRLVTSLKMLHIQGGDPLVEMDSEREEIFIVGSGQIEAYVEGPEGESRSIRTLLPGEVFGERSLLEHKPWPAHYKAARPSVVLGLDKAGLENALTGESDPRGFLDLLRRQRNDRAVLDGKRRVLDQV